MSVIEVIYENGVFRPLQPVQLPEGARAQVSVGGVSGVSEGVQQVRGVAHGSAELLVGEELAALLDQVASLPYAPPSDGRTNVSTHHADILYPKNGRML